MSVLDYCTCAMTESSMRTCPLHGEEGWQDMEWLDDCTHEPPCTYRPDCEDACYRCRPEQTCIEHLARAREDAAHHSADMNRSDR